MLAVADRHDFSEWLQKEMEVRGLSQAELARRSDVTRAAVNGVIMESRGAGRDLLVALAKGLELPTETVFRAAGLLPTGPAQDDRLTEFLNLWDQLTQSDRDDVLDLVRGKARRNKQQSQTDRLIAYLSSLSSEEQRRVIDDVKKLGRTKHERKD